MMSRPNIAGFQSFHNSGGMILRGPTERIEQAELDRILVRSGHAGRTTRTIEYLVRGSGDMTVTYAAVKGGTVSTTVALR